MKPINEAQVAVGCFVATVLTSFIGLGMIAVITMVAGIILAVDANQSKDKEAKKLAKIVEYLYLGFFVLLILGVLWVVANSR